MDDPVVQRIGLLTINLLLDTNRPKQALRVMEMLQNRLGIKLDSWIVDDDDDLEDLTDRGRHDEFRKMFKFCFLRTCLLNQKIITIPIDVVCLDCNS